MVRQIRTLTRDMLVSIVIILIMTAGMLTMWIYKWNQHSAEKA